MRIARFLAAAAFLLPAAAQAEPPIMLHILSTGVAAPGSRVLAMNYKNSLKGLWESGPDFSVSGGTAGRTKQQALAPDSVGDVVIVQKDDMEDLVKAGVILPGTNVSLGRIDLGVAVPKGAPHPDISTYPKFRDALLAAKTVAYTDPAGGSAGGIMIAKILSKPEFAGLKIVLSGMGSQSAARGDAPIAIETMGTLLGTYGVDFIGLVPASLNAHLYFSIGVLAKAPNLKEAIAFEKYALRPQAKPIWKRWGVVR